MCVSLPGGKWSVYPSLVVSGVDVRVYPSLVVSGVDVCVSLPGGKWGECVCIPPWW